MSQPEVNTTPLIDVMLVLLVMFILTLPAALHQTTIALPSGTAATPPREIRVEIDVDGRVYWNGQELADPAALQAHLGQVALDASSPLVRIVPDRRAHYGPVAQVLAAAQRSRVERLAVVGIAD